MNNINKLIHKWRKASLFPSINDIEWRHNEVVARLVQIYERQTRDDLLVSNQSIETQKKIIEFLSYLQPADVTGAIKVRIGSVGDGGYVQLDDLSGVTLALSFGINDNDSWDLEIAKRGIPVLQFDFTIENAPSKHPLLKFDKKKVGGIAGEGLITLQDLISSHEVSTRPNVLLKIDIEGSEWEVFDYCSEQNLSQIGQILCEFHGLSQLDDVGFYSLARRVVEKLHRHFIPYHVHGNNNSEVINIANVVFPDVLEISYANRKIFNSTPSNVIYPTNLDYPNNPERPDIFLGKFQFTV